VTRRLLALLIAVVATLAGAHAHLADSVPAADSLTPFDQAPGVVTLRFTEGVELAFSTFRLVRVEHELDVESDTFTMRLNALAAQLMPDALARRDAEDIDVTFELAPARGTADSLELLLQEPLQPGSYALFWRVLSVDSHVVEGFLVFTILP